MKYRNPILSGFHPDPSICRAGEDFYLVTSTFEFYPGVPVYHSRNLVDWELLGYCMTEENEFNLEKCAPSGGIYAPTIRYHEGMFFMITTNVSDKGHFIVHTENPRNGWSKPQWICEASILLFFGMMMERCIFCVMEMMRKDTAPLKYVRLILLTGSFCQSAGF